MERKSAPLPSPAALELETERERASGLHLAVGRAGSIERNVDSAELRHVDADPDAGKIIWRTWDNEVDVIERPERQLALQIGLPEQFDEDVPQRIGIDDDVAGAVEYEPPCLQKRADVVIEVDAKTFHSLVDLLEDFGAPRRDDHGAPQRVEASRLGFFQNIDPTQSRTVDRNVEMHVRRFAGLREADALDAGFEPIVITRHVDLIRAESWRVLSASSSCRQLSHMKSKPSGFQYGTRSWIL
jgi:hypothetical protein